MKLENRLACAILFEQFCLNLFVFLMPMFRNLPENIINLYLIKTAKWFNLVMPIVVLFYQDNGMNMQQIFWLKSIYSIGIVVMEIPSGYLADIWGRRKTLILGTSLGALGFLIYSFSHQFSGFVIAEIVLGVGLSFVSGADSAMMYDTLKSNQKESEYIKYEGRITSLGNFAEAFAGILAGLLAIISLRTPFYFQTLVAAIGIPAAILLKEPKLHFDQIQGSFKSILQTVKFSFTHSKLRSAILVSSFTGTATLTFAWFVQPFFKEAGLPLSLFGIMWTLLNLSVGTVTMFAYKVENRLGQKKSLLFVIVFLSLFYALTAYNVSLVGIAFLFMFYAVRGIATPVLKDYINRYTESGVRATILSVRNFVIRINFAVIGPVLGYLTDQFSLKTALLATGASYFVVSMISIIPFLRDKEN